MKNIEREQLIKAQVAGGCCKSKKKPAPAPTPCPPNGGGSGGGGDK
ncbi:hypothetical protein HNP46_006635 [Pseudomonas nitritireducens]|uniref:Uncharacterized protein n=1 Tax=Pseudomonas nitroreducens TaxID=46680 RepID=A0A7W7KRY5_PSENT|nr:hypothetical protein [Pseudomonas nitritireducens]MBB4867716.1 hypothetical protein [Pseudomonas nitritireducens]